MNKRLLSGLVLLSGLLFTNIALADDDTNLRGVFASSKQLISVDFDTITHSEGREKVGVVMYAMADNYTLNGKITLAYMVADCGRNTLRAFATKRVNTITDTQTDIQIDGNSAVNVRNNPADKAIYNAICYGISLED